MAYKQEPCPLCGRNMTAIETYPGRGELYCDHCDLTIGGNDAKTPEELIALMDSSEHRRLKAENAELRELVRDVHTLHWNGLDCTECPWFDECDTTGGCPWLGILADHMRELGVEVNA